MDSTIFSATLNQMLYLFALIFIGAILIKTKIMPENSSRILSKLENYLFIPALVMGTFMSEFTVKKIESAWRLMLASLILEIIVIAISVFCVRFCSKSDYIRKIYLYGLSFSNFSFMGNAIVSVLFPEYFLDYLIFTIVQWILIYIWGVPVLLMGETGEKKTVKQVLMRFVNPMFIAMVIGMVIGLSGIQVPKFITTLTTTTGSCMSPIAMLLTGMTVATYDLRSILKEKSIYLVSVLRLVVYPLIFLGSLLLFRFSAVFSICALCLMSMPLGLNTIVIPSAYGKDTRIASGMAVISHALSVITIPLIFYLYQLIV